MDVKAEALEGRLAKETPQLVWVSGEEPLLVQESVDLIRARARQAGYEERVLLSADHQFNWSELREACANRSLFCSKRLIELRLPSAKPGTVGAKLLRELADAPNPGTLLLIVTGKVTAREKKSSWAKALISSGWHVPVYAPSRHQLSGWVRTRLESRKLSIDPEGLRLLAEAAEGNLLAASQEIEKLALISTPGQRVDADLVRNALADGSRFDAFDLVDAALAGEPSRCVRILRRLHEEGVEAIPILSALARELRLLALSHRSARRGKSADRQLASRGVWESRRRLLAKAEKRISQKQTENLLRLAAQIDLSAKGGAEGDPWIGLENLALAMAGKRAMSRTVVAQA